MDTAFNIVTGKAGEFVETSRAIAMCKAELRLLEEECFDKLPVDGKEGCYWWSTDKITNIVAKKNEVMCT